MRGVLWVLIWLASLACLQGMDHTEATSQAVATRLLKKNRAITTMVIISSRHKHWSLEHKITFTINQEKYTFIYANAKFYTDDAKRLKDGMCSGILFKGKLYKGFCLATFYLAK
ncbi:hypothetical protein [Helicobacter suis]|uniref:hypothetical protein n=1 Tax=Helicobacter suis TaxID=104628 RepID=UPI001F0731C2|nr:hypothetical protein [Helicobacter suis]